MSAPMRVLHVDSERTWRGGQRQILELMRRQRRRGDAPVLVCPAESELLRRARTESLPVHGLPMRGAWDPLSVLGIVRLMRRLRPHVTHWHAARAHALGAAASVVVPGPCRVLSRRINLPVRRTLGSRLLYARRLDAIVAISAGVRDSLVASGVDEALIQVIPSGVDLAPFEKPFDRDALRSRLGVERDSILVLMVGSLTKEKAPDVLLSAAAILRARAPSVRVWIAGEGKLRPDLEARMRTLGLEGTVRLLGFREDVADLLRAADLFCLPSRVEGLGSSILDAMAAGLPVVATRVGGIPEIVEDGRSGVLVPADDARAIAESVVATAGNPERRRLMGERGRERVRAFTADRTEAMIRSLYERLLARRGSAWDERP